MSPNPLLRPCSDWTQYLNLTYSNASPICKLNLYVPNNKGPDGKPWKYNPPVLWLHGGSWSAGSRMDPPVSTGQLSPLVKAGFALAVVDYRLSSEAPWPAQLVDVKSAIRALRSIATVCRLWPDKVGVWGASAGGHLAAMCGVTNGVEPFNVGGFMGYPSDVAVVSADFAPLDLNRWVEQPANPTPVPSLTALLGVSPLDEPAAAEAASPISWVTPGDVPVALWHGTSDVTVPIEQSERYKASLVAAGVPVGLLPQPGMTHGQSSYYTAARLATAVGLFDTYLRP